MVKIIIITGQTATGKTKKALQIASEVNGELINCDSRQIYKKLDIITGKDIGDSNFILDRKTNGYDVGYYTINIQNKIPLWLYDVVDPKQYFSSHDYKILALDVISDIFKRGKTPIIVGGAGYYLYHLLYHIPTSGIPQNWKLRNDLSNKKTEELQKEYKLLDPLSYQKLNNSERNNTQRLIRKIEIALYEKNHKKITSSIESSPSLLQQCNLSEKELEINAFIEDDKEKLKGSISMRVNERIDKGAIEEVKQLISQGYKKEDPGLKTIGYQQVISCIENTISVENAKHEWITKEVQYAKRQATFLKKYITSAFLQRQEDF